MVETAQEEEREGDDSYLFSGSISIYTVSPGQRGEKKRGEEIDTSTRVGNRCHIRVSML